MEKSEEITWWGNKSVTVDIVVSASSGEGINDAQRKAYKQYLSEIDTFVTKNLRKAVDYINRNYSGTYDESKVLTNLKPSVVLFQKDGTWGVLFSSSIDVENGFALYKNFKGLSEFGQQDDFL